MPSLRLYPRSTDIYDTAEISITDGVRSSNLPRASWYKSGLILRFLNSPYTDYGSKALSATAGEGIITASGGVATFNGTSALYIPTSNAMFGASPSYFIGYAEFNQSVSASGDQTVFHIAGNGCKSRLLLSGGYVYAQVFFSDASNTYIRFPYTKGENYKVCYKVTNNAGGTITLKVWSNGTFVSQGTYTKTPNTSVLSNSIGSEPNLSQNFLGTMGPVAFYGDELTDEECLNLTIKGPQKYPELAILDMNQDITDSQLTSFVSFSYEKEGDGSLLFRVSSDDGATWDAWDGVSWNSGGTGFNSGTTLNDYLEHYDATSRKLRYRVAHVSDGWQQVGLTFVQTGFNLNSIPNIIAGPSSIVTKGSIVSPALGAYFSDVDDNITKCFYRLSGGPEVEITQGIYATLLEALQNISFETSTWDIGTKSITYIVEDAFGARSQDTTEIFVIANDSQVISDTYSLLQSVSSQLALVKTETDKIQSVKEVVDLIKPETDKITGVKAQTDTLVLIDDKISLIKAQTDTIPNITSDIASIKTQTDTIPDIIVGIIGIKYQTDTLPSIKTETDKIAGIIASQIADHILLDQVHSRFYGARIAYSPATGEYSIFDKSNALIARFKTYDENMNPSGLRVVNVVKQ